MSAATATSPDLTPSVVMVSVPVPACTSAPVGGIPIVQVNPRIEALDQEAGRPEGNSPRRIAGSILLESCDDNGIPSLAYCRSSYWTYGPEPVWTIRSDWPEAVLQRLIDYHVDDWNIQEQARVDAINAAALAQFSQAIALGSAVKPVMPCKEKAVLISDLAATKLNSAVLTQIRTWVGVNEPARGPFWIDKLGTDPVPMNIVPVQNGLLDITDPTRPILLPHDRRFFTPISLPFEYDPLTLYPFRFMFIFEYQFGAPGSDGEDIESKNCILEFFGLCLTPDLSYQKFLILKGVASSGRSTLINCYGPVISERNRAVLEISALTNDHSKATLLDTLLVTFNDVRTSDIHDTIAALQFFLHIVGGDEVHINQKYKDPFSTRLMARPIIISNNLPNLRDMTDALPRRTLTVDFPRKVITQDIKLTEYVVAHELPRILNILLSALGNLRARGRFIQPTSTVELIREMQEESSSLFGFVEEACEIAQPNWACRHITLRDAYAAYEHYSRTVGTHVVSRTRFRKDLMEVVRSLALPVTIVRPWIKDTRGESKRANWEIHGLILTTEYRRTVTNINKMQL